MEMDAPRKKTDEASALGLVQQSTSSLATLKGSLQFTKQFTVVVLSTVCYTRAIFPSYVFANKRFSNLQVAIFNEKQTCPEVHSLTRWVKSAFSALEKKCLRELVFVVMTLEDSVLENYSIQYQYKGDDVACVMSGNDKTIIGLDESSIQMSVEGALSGLLLFIKSLKPLPDLMKLQIRLLYYDERTPDNFNPNYFQDIDPETSPEPLKLFTWTNQMETPFHRICVGMSSKCLAPQLDDEKENRPENNSSFTEKLARNEMDKDAPRVPQSSNLWSQTDQVNKMGHSTSEPTREDPPTRAPRNIVVNCVCGMDQEKTGLFECYICKEWHHLICYKRKPNAVLNSKTNVSCVKCAVEGNSSECLDPVFVSAKVPLTVIENLAVTRQVIYKLQWFAHVNVETLKQDFPISNEQAQKIIKKLLAKKALRPATKANDYYVDTAKLLTFISAYYTRT